MYVTVSRQIYFHKGELQEGLLLDRLISDVLSKDDKCLDSFKPRHLAKVEYIEQPTTLTVALDLYTVSVPMLMLSHFFADIQPRTLFRELY